MTNGASGAASPPLVAMTAASLPWPPAVSDTVASGSLLMGRLPEVVPDYNITHAGCRVPANRCWAALARPDGNPRHGREPGGERLTAGKPRVTGAFADDPVIFPAGHFSERPQGDDSLMPAQVLAIDGRRCVHLVAPEEPAGEPSAGATDGRAERAGHIEWRFAEQRGGEGDVV